MLTYVFVALLLVHVVVKVWLASRQMRHVAAHRDAVPSEFAERIRLASHQRAADYTVARARLGIVERVFDAGVLISLTLLGGLQFLDWLAGAISQHSMLRQLILIGMVTGLLGILGLPFTLYRQFELESRFGFNRMTLKLFAADTLKGIVLGIILGTPLIAAILWLMQEAGTYWWIWAWGLWAAFNILVTLLYPLVIAPLFNTFKPLNDPELAQRIGALATRCGFSLKGLFVMDGSKRSAHGNAYFTGFGRSRRIVFFDTLLNRLTANEVEAVLAHELGHFSRKHIVKRIVLGFGIAFAFFWVLGWLADQPAFYDALGVTPRLTGDNHAMALILFALILPICTFFLTPLASWYSRRDEFEADTYASEQSDARDLISALVKLYDDNAATLTPDPVHSAFYDSHPPATVRIRHLQSLSVAA